MKKLAVVLGVAAVATITGCRDQDYDAQHGKRAQDEVKSIETAPAKPTGVKEVKTVETTTITTTEIKPIDEPLPPVAVKPLPPPAPEYTIYVVQNGDFLAKISKKYNVTINSIKRLNNMKSDTVRVGQKLKLPGKIDLGAQAATTTAATTSATKSVAKASSKTTAKKGSSAYTGATKEYVVKNGDTLGSVAYGNGINIRQLKQLNNLTSDSLKVGQKLKIPAEKVAKAPAKAEASAEAKKAAEVEVKKAEAEVKQAEVAVKEAEVEVKKAEVEAKEAAVEVKAAEAEVKKAEAASATTTYVVQEGEDLTRLAVDFGVTPTVIRELNNLGENDTIKPGQVLKLPAEAQQ